MPSLPDTVGFNQTGDALVIIDQTQLPAKLELLELKTARQVFDAIRCLAVRGAPAIGVAAAGGLYLAARQMEAKDFTGFYQRFQQQKAFLAASRPTAVNLFWALDQMDRAALANQRLPLEQIKEALFQQANAIREADIRTCRSIGQHGLTLLQDGWGILTHCNAGHLAAVRYGTALAPLYLGQEQGYTFHVYADETRPLLQGARLTAFELRQAGFSVTVQCDNMAASLMAQGKIQAVLVGADRIAANGDAANKIGTSNVAILARYYGVPFYVCAPRSTFDIDCPNGTAIPIEQRAAAEVTSFWYDKPMVPAGARVYNPAFDVTPATLITAIVTEAGVLRPPFGPAIAGLLATASQQEGGV